MSVLCKKCDQDFELPSNYFWDLIGDPVQCPHCQAWNTTDWEEGCDGVEGVWTTGVVTGQEPA